MSNQPCRPDNMPWVTPYLMVHDVDSIIDFYTQAFGFELKHKVPGEDGITGHAEMTHHNQVIMMGKVGNCHGELKPKSPKDLGGTSVHLYLYTENVDEFAKHATKQGGKMIGEPENMFWGDRMCTIEDPEGHQWHFATYLGEDAVQDSPSSASQSV